MAATYPGSVMTPGQCLNGRMTPSPQPSTVPGDVGAGALSGLAATHVKELAPDAVEHLMDLGLNLVRASGKYVQMSEAMVLRAHDLRWASFSVLFMASLFPGIEARTIARLTGVTRQAEIQRQLLPAMLGWFAEAPSPDAGLFAFRQVSEALGNTPWYLRALRDEGVTTPVRSA